MASDDIRGITCPVCSRTSYNPNDIQQGYCGNCHDWMSPPGERRPTPVEHNMQAPTDQGVLSCRPLRTADLSLERRLIWEAVCKEMGGEPEIYEGSVFPPCDGCGVTIVLGPRQQETAGVWTAAAVTFRRLCFLCSAQLCRDAVELASPHEDVVIAMGSLGNPGRR